MFKVEIFTQNDVINDNKLVKNHCKITSILDGIRVAFYHPPGLTVILTRLWDNDLFLKPTKYEFNQTKVEYLGLVIKEERISMDPGKLKGIRDWPTPTTVK